MWKINPDQNGKKNKSIWILFNHVFEYSFYILNFFYFLYKNIIIFMIYAKFRRKFYENWEKKFF
jgi:hypothetical protein